MAALLLGGCAGRGNVELLEARLRSQENVLDELSAGLRDAQAELVAARREASALREQLAGYGERTLYPEQAEALYRTAGLEIHRFFTGGLDRDGQPGDDLLSTVLVPRDVQGELIKVPGAVRLELFDMTKPEAERLLGRWEFDADEAAAHWHAGRLASGYLFRLPWQKVPETPELLLHAQLTTPDGRHFQASRAVRVTPPAADRDADLRVPDPADLPADPLSSAAPSGPRRIPAPADEVRKADERTAGPADESGRFHTARRPSESPPQRLRSVSEFPPIEALPENAPEVLHTSDRRTEWTFPEHR